MVNFEKLVREIYEKQELTPSMLQVLEDALRTHDTCAQCPRAAVETVEDQESGEVLRLCRACFRSAEIAPYAASISEFVDTLSE
jgi:flavoprotein